MRKTFVILFVLNLMACQTGMEHLSWEGVRFEEIPNPSVNGGEPNLFVSPDGQTILSWVEYLNDTTDALQFSKLEDGKWSRPMRIASGSNWFVNWADFPSVASFRSDGNTLAAHWLQKSASGTYDYDVRISLSRDGGQHWSSPFVPHRDGIAAEHGFVTLLPLDNDRIFAIWLDGRNTKAGEDHSGSPRHSAAMTLRAAEFDEKGDLFEEVLLDSRVCDCCQTDAALSDTGPVVVYRDRSNDEVRDIALVRKVNDQWMAPQTIHRDAWKIAGCPVNGPAIAADGKTIAIAWFSAAEDVNRVNVSFSMDSGKTFANPMRIDDGNPIGRVDIVLVRPQIALVSWIEQTEEDGEIRLAIVDINGKRGSSQLAAPTTVSRQSGFPILEKAGQNYLLAWTAVDPIERVKTLSFAF